MTENNLFFRIASYPSQSGSVLKRKPECWKAFSIPT